MEEKPEKLCAERTQWLSTPGVLSERKEGRGKKEGGDDDEKRKG